MNGSSTKLTEGFREIIELDWTEFNRLEKQPDLSNFDSVITGLVRACIKGNLRAIQMAIDRLDSKVATEIEVEYPKFYTLYPQATIAADDPGIIDVGVAETATPVIAPVPAEPVGVDEEEELPTGSLRAVLEKMLSSPKDTVGKILATAAAIDAGKPYTTDVYVKSVIIAGLMKLVHDGRVSAVFEVFDRIDGKVADKYKILGDDVYLTSFAAIAPAGAVKNEDGIYQLAADNVTNQWVTRLEEVNERKNNR